ncbi:MAG TPA: response regulator transcription factor [Actinomycetales bacterium]|nr:response regulator transcription factor [Actinomycetales bacterium]
MRDAEPEARLLVVDDEPNIRELLATSLRFAGFDVESASGGNDAIKKVGARRPDLVVLDVMMPDMDGYTTLRRIRAVAGPVPVVFLTARDDTQDKVKGLTAGGDDYITKPFSLEEVVARIRAVLRRTKGESEDDAILRYADLEINEDAYEVRRGGQLIQLAPTEFKLLRYLVINAERVVSKSQILDHVWEYDFMGDPNIVESYISYLRRKIDTPGREPLIHTRRTVGYILRREPKE